MAALEDKLAGLSLVAESKEQATADNGASSEGAGAAAAAEAAAPEAPAAAAPAAPKLLYVDGLNYASTRFFVSPSHWDVAIAAENVTNFVAAAKASGFSLKVFLDAAIPSEEAQKKWIDRREREVRSEKRNVPHGMNLMTAELFKWVPG